MNKVTSRKQSFIGKLVAYKSERSRAQPGQAREERV